MITGIGIDLVKIERFASWIDFPDEKLRKVFNEGELLELQAYRDENGAKAEAQFVASRYAAKEAFYKALSATLVHLNHTAHTMTFLQVCKHVSIIKGRLDVPTCVVDWHHYENFIYAKLPLMHVHLSLSHEVDYATASVMIEKV